MPNKPIIIAAMCHKGGVGKTTTVVEVGDCLSFLYPDKRILLLDADEQSNLKTVFGLKLRAAEGGLASILLDDVNPEHATVNVRSNIDIILSGGRMMREFDKRHSNTPGADHMLKRRLEHISLYDFIIIDSPPALSLISSNIVHFADYIVMPCTPDLLAIVGVKNTVAFLDNLEGSYRNKDDVRLAKILGVIPTIHDDRRLIDVTIVEDLNRMEENDLLRGGVVFKPIRSDIKVKTAQIKRKLLLESFPNSKAALDFKDLTSSIINQIEMRTSSMDGKPSIQTKRSNLSQKEDAQLST